MDQPVESFHQKDLVRPGEQWFFYWKTSAALWESRILEIPSKEVIFIPIYWGFHAESPGSWDFGEIHPERDLFRLTQLMTQHGRKFCWLLPLTPSPFLPNGGVPVGAARTLSTNDQGLHLALLDAESKLNKLYSYFEPKVFQAFSQFVSAYGKFLASKHIKAPVWGIDFQYQQDGKTHSYINDLSVAFEQGFSRYLKKSHPQGIEINEPLKEIELKETFTVDVFSLFSTTAESMLAPFWQGIQKITILGGSPQETIARSLAEGQSQSDYFKNIFFHYSRHEWISSCLLGPQEKRGLLPDILREHFGTSEVEERFHYRQRSSTLDPEWRPYGIAEIFDDVKKSHYQSTGLLSFLDDNYRWMYQLQTEMNFTTEWIESNAHKVKFFHGANMDRLLFGQMLKLFMMGHRIVFDKTGLKDELEKRLQIFYLENNLKIQSVNYLTSIHLCEIGEGKFISFEGEKLKDNPKKKDFWKNLFRWFNLSQPEVLMDQEVYGLWRIRATSADDLNYLDVRRFSLYNPTSYRKQVTIHTQKHFAYMKMVDPVRAQAKSISQGVEVELLPGGRVSMDFGHYEEER